MSITNIKEKVNHKTEDKKQRKRSITNTKIKTKIRSMTNTKEKVNHKAEDKDS